MNRLEKQNFLNEAAYRFIDAERNHRKAEPEMKQQRKKELKNAQEILSRAVDSHKQTKVQP